MRAGGRALTPAQPLRLASPGGTCPHLTEPPPGPPDTQIPGTAASPWGYFADSFLWGFDCLGGKICSCFLSVKLWQSDMGPFPRGTEEGTAGVRLPYQTRLSGISKPYANCKVVEESWFPLLFSPPPPSGAPPSPLSHSTPPPPQKSPRLRTTPSFLTSYE